MKILGLDLSLTNTGWVIYDTKLGYMTDAGTIKSKLRGVLRLADIDLRITNLIDNDLKMIAVIEGYAFSPNQGRSFSIGELGGVIKRTLFAYDIDYYIVAPTSLKKFATGKGNAPKSTIEKEVYKRWNVEFKTEHEVDAFVLAKIGEAIIGKVKKLTKAQKEVVKTVIQDKSKRNYMKEAK